jgi:hypothetical protein
MKRMLGAELALFQMRSEPRAFSFRNPFNACLGDQLQRPVVNAVAHP